MAKSTPDHIERSAIIPASRDRVWDALTDAHQFAQWFGIKFSGSFEPGELIRGSITDEDFHGLPVVLEIGEMDTGRRFSWRWHPAPVNPNVDYSREPTTQVEFTLEDAPAGTHLTVVESGFSEIPLQRRDAAYRMNYEGWGNQMTRIEAYVRSKGEH